MNFSARSRLAILAVLGVVAAAAPRSKQPEWHVSSLKARIVINPDSSLLVDGTQIIPESSDPNFGLRCEIPIGECFAGRHRRSVVGPTVSATGDVKSPK